MRLRSVPRRPVVADRCGDDHPHGISGGVEIDPGDRFVFDRPDAAIKPDIRAAVFSRPDHFAVAARGRGPPVADVQTGAHPEFRPRSVAVSQGDAPQFGNPGTPRQRMEQIEPASPRTVGSELAEGPVRQVITVRAP
ncbi:hypothetical protein SDC9_169426 [bioreactor metagenome]|uniref:Uncharacterized protein n=1 Tax=bioreactor metagenome TaxID=1076179 RepID=A0A645GE02_9ZZZZ